VDRESVEARLRDIQSITDAALSRLDERELLTELLDRVRDILQADTAAVLLLDFASRQLIATVAAGLEDEVRQGVRIPLGQGFAGRIAAEARPVILDQVDHTTVLNPILWTKGIRSLMGVPMVAGGRVIGVMHVGSLTPRQFSGQDIELLQLAGDRAAAAVQSIAARTDRVAAAALQRSLVPSVLPAVAGVGWPPATFRVAAGWVVTGMTCSPCRRGSCAW
jgi:GAF domain-containing protein